jgi:hypothetical protein
MNRETTVFRKVSHYREVFEYPFSCSDRSGREWVTSKYHRPLSWWLRAFKNAGLAVTAFEEPEPTEEFRSEDYRRPWIEEIPIHCVIEARKVDRLDGASLYGAAEQERDRGVHHRADFEFLDATFVGA